MMWGGYTTQSGMRDYEKSLSSHINIMLKGGSFCIFPEGGITRDGKIGPARGGMSYLAERAKCPIIPVSVHGVYGMSVADFFQGKRRITITFGKPISQEELEANVPRSGEAGDNIYKKKGDYVLSKVGEGLRNKR
jgi:1-acyl-sn-glycerol-3-phosphate acyltransferase